MNGAFEKIIEQLREKEEYYTKKYWYEDNSSDYGRMKAFEEAAAIVRRVAEEVMDDGK